MKSDREPAETPRCAFEMNGKKCEFAENAYMHSKCGQQHHPTFACHPFTPPCGCSPFGHEPTCPDNGLTVTLIEPAAPVSPPQKCEDCLWHQCGTGCGCECHKCAKCGLPGNAVIHIGITRDDYHVFQLREVAPRDEQLKVSIHEEIEAQVLSDLGFPDRPVKAEGVVLEAIWLLLLRARRENKSLADTIYKWEHAQPVSAKPYIAELAEIAAGIAAEISETQLTSYSRSPKIFANMVDIIVRHLGASQSLSAKTPEQSEVIILHCSCGSDFKPECPDCGELAQAGSADKENR